MSDEIFIEVIDRIGGGDAYTAGFLAEYLGHSKDLKRAVAIGNAASAIKHTIPGDLLRSTRADIEEVAFGTSHTFVRR